MRCHKKALPDARKKDLIPPLPLSGRTVLTFRYYKVQFSSIFVLSA